MSGHKSYMTLSSPEPVFGSWGNLIKRKLELVSWDVKPIRSVVRDGSLYNSPSRRALYDGPLIHRGSFVVRANYEGLEELYRGVSGSYAFTAGTAPAGDHTFKEGSSLSGYSFEVGWSDVPANKVGRLLGAKLTDLKVRGAAGTGDDAMLLAEFSVIAKDFDTNVLAGQTPTASTAIGPVANCTISAHTLTRASGSFISDAVVAGMAVIHANVPTGTIVKSVDSALSLTMSCPGTNAASLSVSFASLQFPSPLPVMFHQSGTAGWVDDGFVADGSARVRSFEFALSNPMSERYYFGSSTIDEPLRSDFLKAEWSFTEEFNTLDAYNAARLFTTGSPKMLFQHPTALASATFRELEIRSGTAKLVDFSAPIAGYDKLIATLKLEASLDATDGSSFVIRTRNGYPQLT